MTKSEKTEKRARKATAAGERLQMALKKCFGETHYLKPLYLHMGIPRQTGWSYTQKGIAPIKRPSFEEFVNNPKSGFELLPGTEIDDYIRPSFRKVRVDREINATLASVLYRIIQTKGFGQHTIESMAYGDQMGKGQTPHTFWKWAYVDGGVPSSYQEPFVQVLAIHHVHTDVLGFDTIDQLRTYVMGHLACREDRPPEKKRKKKANAA